MKSANRMARLLFGCRLLLLIVSVLAAANSAAAESCVVDRLTDTGEGEGPAGDLRYCLTRATSCEDTITFSVTGTINLTGALPDLNANVTIVGPGASSLIVRRDTGGNYRIFTVGCGATVSISGLTVTDGRLFAGEGAGIHNSGTLTLSDSIISHNAILGGRGGGMYNAGTLIMSNSAISDNYDNLGGGLANFGSATITNSTFSGNSADPTAGAIYNGPGAELTVSNSTLSGNFGVIAGAVYNEGTLALSHSTITDNGTGLFGGALYNDGTLSARNTIIAGNWNFYSFRPDLTGNLGSLGHNMISDSSEGSGFHETDLLLDVLGIYDPRLGPLQDNGGPTLTHALLVGSPAIDAGDNTDAPEWDQRGLGYPRIVNQVIDIGAFEVQGDASARPCEPGVKRSPAIDSGDVR
jgi:hypothetical protein